MEFFSLNIHIIIALFPGSRANGEGKWPHPDNRPDSGSGGAGEGRVHGSWGGGPV